ncbi:ABC transporter permease subunit [Heyndrickxia sporothermodurans]|uniref:ABC transporter permease subunit n=1 Tax=Heyndrickxia sporothermodurans TaxID=46224 RepID=A0AB37HCD4_9BACI|nr:ABC transporter permease subunit [Heyndrickxia sporothermodurans]MBL5769075.1 ABC transporter permease subunit [Heyndrickxia sporothermodurans]MBL5772790.1 ABC transporter permease subunit [Heyndrickxia sporothermodurans]MBL5776212.1 ABC transporter permease subunit [Heyndrickxia sporothermodurans]MBL5786956.1 ABC transporter permease subunit [Heyndrickxia sporothermodurans]MBL5790495.1 ABC transporter permease subunit [Heyndrickxia sporothermodurans]
MSLYYRILLKFVLTTIGIVLVAAIPALFQGLKLDISAYVSEVGSIVLSVIHLDTLTYNLDQDTYRLFPDFWARWRYSITLMFIAVFLSFFLAMVLTFFTMLLPEKLRRKIKFLLFLGESIPDVFVVGLFTVIVPLIYKHTDTLIFNIVAFGNERIFVLPIIVLAVLPTLLLYRIMIHNFEEETSQLYIDVARAKGLTKERVLFSHVLRNAIINIFLHVKSIMWFMLSNLLIVEFVFNLDGLMHFMFDNLAPNVLAVGMFFVFFPIYFMNAIGQVIIEKTTGRQLEG